MQFLPTEMQSAPSQPIMFSAKIQDAEYTYQAVGTILHSFLKQTIAHKTLLPLTYSLSRLNILLLASQLR